MPKPRIYYSKKKAFIVIKENRYSWLLYPNVKPYGQQKNEIMGFLYKGGAMAFTEKL